MRNEVKEKKGRGVCAWGGYEERQGVGREGGVCIACVWSRQREGGREREGRDEKRKWRMGEMRGGEQERIDGNMSKMVVGVEGERDKEKWRTVNSAASATSTQNI